MNKIVSGSFAEACFNQNSISELKEALVGDCDESDCEDWGISPTEWRENIECALAAKILSAAEGEMK